MNYLKALIYFMPDAEFSLVGNEYSGLNWIDERPKPTKEELEIAFQELTQKGVDPLKGEDWEGLQNDLRGSALFSKAIGTSHTNGFSLLLSTLAVTRNVHDLEFALGLVRSGLSPDYTPEEVAEINALLAKHQIRLVIE